MANDCRLPQLERNETNNYFLSNDLEASFKIATVHDIQVIDDKTSLSSSQESPSSDKKAEAPISKKDLSPPQLLRNTPGEMDVDELLREPSFSSQKHEPSFSSQKNEPSFSSQKNEKPESSNIVLRESCRKDTETEDSSSCYSYEDSVASDNCCTKCMRCLGSVPCPTLCCWLLMLMTSSGCAGSLMVGAIKIRKMLEENDDFLSQTTWVGIGTIAVMAFFSTFFLIIAFLSGGRISSIVFKTRNKNICGRILNVIIVLIMFLLQFIWMVVSCAISVLLCGVILAQILYKIYKVKCLNLQYYGLYPEETLICDEKLSLMIIRSQDVLICLSIAFLTSLLVVKSLTCFILCAAANFVHLKETVPKKVKEIIPPRQMSQESLPNVKM